TCSVTLVHCRDVVWHIEFKRSNTFVCALLRFHTCHRCQIMSAKLLRVCCVVLPKPEEVLVVPNRETADRVADTATPVITRLESIVFGRTEVCRNFRSEFKSLNNLDITIKVCHYAVIQHRVVPKQC